MRDIHFRLTINELTTEFIELRLLVNDELVLVIFASTYVIAEFVGNIRRLEYAVMEYWIDERHFAIRYRTTKLIGGSYESYQRPVRHRRSRRN